MTTTTTVSQEAVEVTQADREAAVRFLKSADLITLDRYEQSLAQAFARHRQSAERAFEERERKLREALETLEAALTRDMGAGYAGVALCQALKETHNDQ